MFIPNVLLVGLGVLVLSVVAQLLLIFGSIYATYHFRDREQLIDPFVQQHTLEMAITFINAVSLCQNETQSVWLDRGSLLGAIRTGGWILWDDNMNFGMLNWTPSNLLACLSSTFSIQPISENKYRVYDPTKPEIYGLSVRLYKTCMMLPETGNILHDSPPILHMFPLSTTLFEGHLFPSPNDDCLGSLLEQYYGPKWATMGKITHWHPVTTQGWLVERLLCLGNFFDPNMSIPILGQTDPIVVSQQTLEPSVPRQALEPDVVPGVEALDMSWLSEPMDII